MLRETIEVDTREQNPVRFPETLTWCPRPHQRVLVQLTTKRVKLDAGDYRLKGCGEIATIERKAGVDELAKNLLDRRDKVRFAKAWSRFLSSCRYPILLIDGSLAACCRMEHPTEHMGPEDVMASFWRHVFQAQVGHRLLVIWSGPAINTTSRINLGIQLVTLLLSLREFHRQTLTPMIQENVA